MLHLRTRACVRKGWLVRVSGRGGGWVCQEGVVGGCVRKGWFVGFDRKVGGCVTGRGRGWCVLLVPIYMTT